MLRRWTSLTHRRWAFLLCLLGVLVLSLVPPVSYLPTTAWDKANHAIAFAVLAALGCWSYRDRTVPVLAGLLAYGALIEVLQALTPYRMAEWTDLFADGVGLVLGWQVMRILRQVAQSAASTSPGRGRSQ